MGNIQASETKQTLADYTQVVNSTVVNTFNTAIQQCTSGNTLALDTGNGCIFDFINGTFDVTQVANTQCTFNSQNVVNATSSFQNNIQTATKNFIDQNLQNQQGWFATAFSLQISGAENSTQVSQLVSNAFQGNFTNRCQATSNALNQATVNLCGVFDATTFDFNQNALTTALTSCANEVVTNVFTTNTVLNQLWSQTDQKLASQQAGVGSFIFYIIIAIIGFIVLMIVIALVYMLIEGHVKSQQKSYSQSKQVVQTKV